MGILPGREYYESDEEFARELLKSRRAFGMSIRETFGDNACSVCGWGRRGHDPCLDCREVMAAAGEPVPGETVEKGE
jgi:hypothetical protein